MCPFFVQVWITEVPILLILAGSMALQRPMREVAEVLVMTNTYIVFVAWQVWAGLEPFLARRISR